MRRKHREHRGSYVPAGEEQRGEEEEGGDAVGVDEEDVAAHAVGGGELEERVEADVEALHRHHGGERHHVSVAVAPVSGGSTSRHFCRQQLSV